MPFVIKSNKRYIKIEIFLKINCQGTNEINDWVTEIKKIKKEQKMESY
jgi:hypothetical protein